jgi:CRP/FNR family transcriptional regulator, cyclic AMP receptor protein
MPNYQLDYKTWEMLFSLGTIREYRAGEIIYYQEELNTGLVCLKKGQLKNCLFMLDGTEKQLNVLNAPSITAETSVVDDGRSICSAVAITDVILSVIPQDKARKVLFENPQLMDLTLHIMAKKMRSILMQVEGVVTTIPQRLARMLLTVEEYGVYTHQEHSDQLIITHDEMARFLGTTRPKITEFFSEFAKLGLIERGRGYIKIVNKDGLKEIREKGLKVKCH